jgi:hypothetical protein
LIKSFGVTSWKDIRSTTYVNMNMPLFEISSSHGGEYDVQNCLLIDMIFYCSDNTAINKLYNKIALEKDKLELICMQLLNFEMK